MKNTNMKHHPLIGFLMNSLINLPTPSSISFMWNMGFLLGMTLSLQLISGIMLSMNFVAHTDLAFDSVIHIMRDMNLGWYMRYAHMNGASLFFILLYAHLMRGIYFNSPQKLPLVWMSGLLLTLISMMTAFMGYVLPWGQMSFWGATVITSMISSIPYLGQHITTWVWGNFSVSQPTLNRFLSLHFILPIIISFMVLMHLMFLHQTGSSNPLMINPNIDKTKFFPIFMIKDLSPMVLLCLMFLLLLSLNPNMLGDVENFNKASYTSTPNHIQPEWYFLFAYAILRSIPSKLGGVICMMMSILVLTVLSFKKDKKNSKFSPQKKSLFWLFLWNSILLTWIGSNPVEPPFTTIGMILTLIYFSIIFMI